MVNTKDPMFVLTHTYNPLFCIDPCHRTTLFLRLTTTTWLADGPFRMKILTFVPAF